MKQKITIKVTLQNEKIKSKAMQIVVAVRGVASVTVEKTNDKMIVTGEGINVVCLVTSLRKKFCYVEIVTVEEVKPPEVKPPVVKPPVVKPPPPPPPLCRPTCPSLPCYGPLPCPPPCPSLPSCHTYYECPVYDSNPPNCSFM